MLHQIDDVARVYAESLFQLAEKAGGMERAQEVGAELAGVAEIAGADRRFAEFLRTPIIDRASREKALTTILAGRISDLLLHFILVMNRKGRAGSLFAVDQAYDGILQEKLGKVEVDVWTAGPLGPEALRTIQERVAKSLGKQIVVHSYTDRAIIGGVKLRIGDRLIDGSVAAKLRAIRAHLAKGGGDVRGRFGQFLGQ